MELTVIWLWLNYLWTKEMIYVVWDVPYEEKKVAGILKSFFYLQGASAAVTLTLPRMQDGAPEGVVVVQ